MGGMRCTTVGVNNTRIKSLQADKIKEVGQALVVSGFACLDQQAHALGINRSTAWTILNARHKTSGLTAVVINQMLAAPQLPPLVRAKLIEYIEEKIAGVYGHSPEQVRRFAKRLKAEPLHSNGKLATGRYTAMIDLQELHEVVQIGHGHVVESARRMTRSTELIKEVERKIAASLTLIERSRPLVRGDWAARTRSD